MDVIALGLILGLGAGLAPGPRMELVVLAALEHGFAAGARAATVPLPIDPPAVVLTALAVLAALLRDPVLALGVVLAFGALLTSTRVVVARLVAAEGNRGWRRAVPGGLTARFGAPGAHARLRRGRTVSTALYVVAAAGLVAGALARL